VHLQLAHAQAVVPPGQLGAMGPELKRLIGSIEVVPGDEAVPAGS